MKYVIGCLAIIGILTVLVIGGCFGLIGYGIASLPKIPDYVNRNEIESNYSSDLSAIRKGIQNNNEDKIKTTVSAEICAIYKGDKDILGKYKIISRSHHVINNVGVGKLDNGSKEIDCMVYEIQINDSSYDIFIYDRKTMSNQPLKGR